MTPQYDFDTMELMIKYEAKTMMAFIYKNNPFSKALF